MADEIKTTGYRGRWAFVDLTNRTVRIEPADPPTAAITSAAAASRPGSSPIIWRRRARSRTRLRPANRIILGSAAPNDTAVPTAGRGSCSFVGTMTRSPGTRPLDPRPQAPSRPRHPLERGRTVPQHAQAGRDRPDRHRRPGGPSRPPRGRPTAPAASSTPRTSSSRPSRAGAFPGRLGITDYLTAGLKGSSTVCRGPGRLEQGRFRLPDRRSPPQLRPRRRGRRVRIEEPRRHHRARPRSRRLRRSRGVPDAGRELDALIKATSAIPRGRRRSGRRRARPGGSTGPSTATTWGAQRRLSALAQLRRGRLRRRRLREGQDRRLPGDLREAQRLQPVPARHVHARAPRSRTGPTPARACGRSSRRSPCGSTAASSTATPSST